MTIIYCKNCGCQVVGEVRAMQTVWECDECSPNPSPGYRRSEAVHTNQGGARRIGKQSLLARHSKMLLILALSFLLIHAIAVADSFEHRAPVTSSTSSHRPALNTNTPVGDVAGIDGRKNPHVPVISHE
jgi:hypothetical protein